MNNLLNVYNQLDMEVSKAEGNNIWDTNGNKYIDFFSGISVTNLGHRPKEVIKAIEGALAQYMHISNIFPEKYQKELAGLLVEKTMPESKVFFSNSGAEANECAIKVARKFFDGEKFKIITFKNSFHGRTLATLAATGQSKFRKGFGPVVEGFDHLDFNFLATVEENITPETAAIMVEPIQGEGGINVGTKEFMEGLRKLCDEKKILLISDEIQTGMGRTGKFLGIDNYGIEADIVTLGKALGGGLPLAATLIKDKVASCMEPGDHGSTFGGNPVSCAAGLAAVNAIDDDMLENVAKKGKIFRAGLEGLTSRHETIKEVRGKGLMLGMELNFKGAGMVKYLQENGFIANCTRERVLRFLPPFTIRKSEIDSLIDCIDKYFKERG
ncbi:MAG: aspartate aminotransferase family protein [Elusimicrobia bacterium]|jgi:acetylornithine/N-succinyldiaminopimelate aminotransferase|nr:aspartate aminotransferase family protein [Elusimicrobiota bacterium]